MKLVSSSTKEPMPGPGPGPIGPPPADWITFKQRRNKCTTQMKKAKSEFYLAETNKNLNNPKMFWKVDSSASAAMSSNELPKTLVKEFVNPFTNCAMLMILLSLYRSRRLVWCFKRYSQNGCLYHEPAIANSPVDCSFHLEPASTSEVYHDFKGGCWSNCWTSDLYLIWPWAHTNNETWKSAFVLPIQKGREAIFSCILAFSMECCYFLQHSYWLVRGCMS